MGVPVCGSGWFCGGLWGVLECVVGGGRFFDGWGGRVDFGLQNRKTGIQSYTA